QALGDWLALLCALFWVGGLFWEEFTLPARYATDPLVALGARLGARRFLRLAPWALGGALLADVAVALALTVQVAGSWRGALIPQYWQATLFSGSFGAYWWLRQVTLAVGLALTLLALRRASRDAADLAHLPEEPGAADTLAAGEPPPWPRAALEVIRQTPTLPRRLARGVADRPFARQMEVALGLLLLFAFAMSGHAAATPPNERAYAVTVDLAHLIFSAVWLGGLLYISVVLVPAARALPARARTWLLARGVPEFSVVAIVSAAALALTGSLNATVHLTSLAQFANTAYGRVLFVKIELFLIMVAISAFHAFWLRPRLSLALARARTAQPIARRPAGVSAEVSAAHSGAGEAQSAGLTPTLPRLVAAPPARAAQNGHSTHSAADDEVVGLRRHMEDWLRREALLGVGVLLCVALLALFAGSLAPAQASAPTSAATIFSQTHTVSGYAITLRVDPAKFGQNTFTVTLANASGKPVTGASTLLLTDDLDMDMGQQSVQAQPVVARPGVYSAQGQLTMAGHWSVTVKVLPPGAKDFITTSFKLIAGS
ncbi:MAG TPA: CopD family protein, partial [Ktedonobacterales bacterium]